MGILLVLCSKPAMMDVGGQGHSATPQPVNAIPTNVRTRRDRERSVAAEFSSLFAFDRDDGPQAVFMEGQGRADACQRLEQPGGGASFRGGGWLPGVALGAVDAARTRSAVG